MAAYRPSIEEHFAADGPKWILSLEGGGVRSMLSLGFLARIETFLGQPHGDDPGFRLCHDFDLIAGTSTGSITAVLLALGKRVQEVIGLYLAPGGGGVRSALVESLMQGKGDGLNARPGIIDAVLGTFSPHAGRSLQRGPLRPQAPS